MRALVSSGQLSSYLQMEHVLTTCSAAIQVGSCHLTCACATQMSLLEPSHHPQPPLAALDLAWWVILLLLSEP